MSLGDCSGHRAIQVLQNASARPSDVTVTAAGLLTNKVARAVFPPSTGGSLMRFKASHEGERGICGNKPAEHLQSAIIVGKVKSGFVKERHY